MTAELLPHRLICRGSGFWIAERWLKFCFLVKIFVGKQKYRASKLNPSQAKINEEGAGSACYLKNPVFCSIIEQRLLILL